MPKKGNILSIIKWLARILGALAIGILIFGIFSEPNEFNSTFEIFTFIFFPVATIIGLLIAFKWEGFGGLIAVAGMIGLHIMRTDLVTDAEINAFAIPGLLYIIYSVWNKN